MKHSKTHHHLSLCPHEEVPGQEVVSSWFASLLLSALCGAMWECMIMLQLQGHPKQFPFTRLCDNRRKQHAWFFSRVWDLDEAHAQHVGTEGLWWKNGLNLGVVIRALLVPAAHSFKKPHGNWQGKWTPDQRDPTGALQARLLRMPPELSDISLVKGQADAEGQWKRRLCLAKRSIAKS